MDCKNCLNSFYICHDDGDVLYCKHLNNLSNALIPAPNHENVTCDCEEFMLPEEE